jgi:hypothetical protein
MEEDMVAESYPLQWPEGWPRTQYTHRGKSRFGGQTYNQIKELHRQLRLLGASNVVISSNVPVRNDGLPYADAAKRRYDDPGVAVYFTLKGKPLSMARDKYWTPWENMRSLVLTIDGLRSMERHGGSTMMERAFSGFAAIAPPDDCWKILSIDKYITAQKLPDHRRAYVMDAFRIAAREGHGNGVDMDRLVKARDEALKQLGVT